MSRPFSVQTVLRMVPNPLLRACFTRLGVGDLGISWDSFGKRDLKPLLAALHELPRRLHDQVEAALHNVFDLACETGICAFFEAAEHCASGLVRTDLPDDGGAYAQAMWVWLHRPDVFEKATLIHRIDHLTWWRKRDDLPCGLPDHSAAARARLEHEVSTLLLTEQGRGKDCSVESFQRGELHYFFAHPDDYVQNVTAHDEHGVLTPRTFRQTFMLAFAYHATDGTLELFAKGPGKMKQRLEELFAQIILGTALPPWVVEPAYNLAPLKDPSFALVTDAADGVTAAIRRLRLQFRNSDRRLLLEADPARGADDIYRMVEECLRRDAVSWGVVDITLASFCLEFAAVNGRKAGRLTFDVATPNSCSLRNQAPERIELAEKYLKRWGVVHVRPAAVAAGPAGG